MRGGEEGRHEKLPVVNDDSSLWISSGWIELYGFCEEPSEGEVTTIDDPFCFGIRRVVATDPSVF